MGVIDNFKPGSEMSATLALDNLNQYQPSNINFNNISFSVDLEDENKFILDL